ncbi:hypothetical protein EGH10_00615 [Brevibacillus laterosporus]|uniref:Uncharacterized protein n=1 Tax=Brevibacillus laterosporus LMG 15441 TaxID=1042163 RepID=A0A075RB89_BRELA|nr:hypothetical protein [Brevibacillus laterosporus]AIG28661.1 hypothetical protein BRLA_c043970 [Brevibacillus laterosporus LMG 15441]RJL12014.1 hypothetical protein DM460_09635 [Brevibacillus laterosporus]TPH19647.1 hypothetical protein EGH10_00615 [Brevibacillus laterosporus]
MLLTKIGNGKDFIIYSILQIVVKVGAILRELVEGKSRDLLAKELGHKNYKTLDIYMRRKNLLANAAQCQKFATDL